jgi:hypothetical protein
VLADEAGHPLDADAVLAAMCRALLDGGNPGERPGRARHQIAVTTCDRCKRGWQTGGGEPVEIPPAAIAAAACDAVHIGRLDAASPAPMTKDIPDAVRRLVWARDHGRCRVPGCRSTRNLDLHHIRHREDGGDHTADNLLLLCAGHHRAHHEGAIAITGSAADAQIVFLREAVAAPAASPPASTSDHAHTVRHALVQLGYKDGEARAAVARAMTHVGHAASFDEVLRAALQASRKPRPG